MINGRYGLRLREGPGNGPLNHFREFGEAQIVGTVSQKPSNAKGWGNCFITMPPHPAFIPLPLCHPVFIHSPHISRFESTHAPDASPHPDLRDGTEEESCEPEEGKPKEGRSGSQSRRRVGAITHGGSGALEIGGGERAS